MKRFVVILILVLLGRVVDATVLPLGSDLPASSTTSASSVSADAVALHHHDECHEMGVTPDADNADVPGAHHSLPKCHTCCVSMGLHPSPYQLPVTAARQGVEPARRLQRYTDITYAIDKPPKPLI